MQLIPIVASGVVMVSPHAVKHRPGTAYWLSVSADSHDAMRVRHSGRYHIISFQRPSGDEPRRSTSGRRPVANGWSVRRFCSSSTHGRNLILKPAMKLAGLSALEKQHHMKG